MELYEFVFFVSNPLHFKLREKKPWDPCASYRTKAEILVITGLDINPNASFSEMSVTKIEFERNVYGGCDFGIISLHLQQLWKKSSALPLAKKRHGDSQVNVLLMSSEAVG